MLKKKRKKKTVTTTNRQLLCRESQPQMYIIKLFAISFWYVMIPRTLRQPNSSSNHVLAQRIFPVSFVARGFAVSHVSIFYFCWSDFLCPFDSIQLISTWKPETKSHTHRQKEEFRDRMAKQRQKYACLSSHTTSKSAKIWNDHRLESCHRRSICATFPTNRIQRYLWIFFLFISNCGWPGITFLAS